jgi:flavin-dependent dehydrogenase
LFNKPPNNEIQIYLADGIYCGINPVNDNQSTICFLSSPQRNPAQPKDHIDFLRKNNKKFGELFTQEFDKISGDLKFFGTSNIYFGRREKHIDGVYFTGDASGVIAPLAGDGIGIALESAKLLAKHLLLPEVTPDEYELSWNKLFSSRLRTAKLIQHILLSSRFKNFAINTVSLFPSLPAYFIARTRSTNKS